MTLEFKTVTFNESLRRIALYLEEASIPLLPEDKQSALDTIDRIKRSLMQLEVELTPSTRNRKGRK